jgi:hypothetical protein
MLGDLSVLLRYFPIIIIAMRLYFCILLQKADYSERGFAETELRFSNYVSIFNAGVGGEGDLLPTHLRGPSLKGMKFEPGFRPSQREGLKIDASEPQMSARRCKT